MVEAVETRLNHLTAAAGLFGYHSRSNCRAIETTQCGTVVNLETPLSFSSVSQNYARIYRE
jgi:hypothetical protein